MGQYLDVLAGLVSSPAYLFIVMCGVGMGIFLGILPGISAPMALSIMVPLTFTMEPTLGFGLLIGIFNGVVFGGSVPAVLVNIPGTPSAAVTTLDGYPLTCRGEASKALSIVLVSSFIGGLFSIFILIIVAPQLAKLAMKLSPHDYFAIGMLGLSITTGISGKSVLLGFWSAMFGVLLSTVGMDYVTGEHRFVYGVPELLGGVPFLPIMVGLYGFSYIFENLHTNFTSNTRAVQNIGRIIPTVQELKSLFRSILQGSIVGTFIGALPGPGGTIASFLSYDIAKRTSKNDRIIDPYDFGEGRLEGIAAPEAANNAVTGGCLIPALTMGIPGDAVAAIMLGALVMHNFSPGPLFFQNNLDMVYGIYNSLIISNIFMFIFGICSLKILVKAISISDKILVPAVLVMCITGAYTIHNNSFGILVALIFGVIGTLFNLANIPTMPLILGLVLGPMIENGFRQAMIIEAGNFWGILERPSSGIILFGALILLFLPNIRSLLKIK